MSSFTGPIKATLSVVDGTVEGECGIWNAFVLICVQDNFEVKSLHKKYLLGKTKFDVCVGRSSGLGTVLLSTEPMASGNIKPNVTFTIDVVLNLGDIDFILTPNLEEETGYKVAMIDNATYKVWAEQVGVVKRLG